MERLQGGAGPFAVVDAQGRRLGRVTGQSVLAALIDPHRGG